MYQQYEFAWHSGIFLITCLVLLLIAKFSFNLFNRTIKVDRELTEKDNLAFFLGYIGYYTGFIMILGGVMKSEGSGDIWNEVLYSFIYGLIGIVILNVVAIILDKFIYPKKSLWTSVLVDENIPVGVIKGANYLSTGIIVGGVLLTEVDKPFEAAIFLLFSIVVASIGTIYYNIITPFNIKEEIYKGNLAVAISTGGAQVAFAILIHAGFQLEHSSWSESLMTIGIDVLGGVLILPIIRFVVDKLFLPKRKLTDEIINQEKPNIGAGMFEAMAYIGGAILFIWCWNL